MRLRKKNVSRVAAVAVAAVMAVSAAAPAAVAAAPAVNGGTAVVQEDGESEHVIGINYKDGDGNFIQTGSVKVSTDATQITAEMLTDVPANWVVDPVFVPLNINSDTQFVDIYCKPATPAPTTKVVKINFYSEAEKKQIAEPRLIVAANATSVNSSALTAPKGYELCETGDFAIRDGYVYVAVRKATTPDPVDPTPTPDPEPTPAPTVNPVTTALGVGTWLLILGGLVLGFLGL